MIARVFDRAFGVEELNLRLRDELFRAEDVELRHEAGIELGFGRRAQPARSLQRRLGDGDERLLRDDPVVRRGRVDGDSLLDDRPLERRIDAASLGGAERAARHARPEAFQQRLAERDRRIRVVEVDVLSRHTGERRNLRRGRAEARARFGAGREALQDVQPVVLIACVALAERPLDVRHDLRPEIVLGEPHAEAGLLDGVLLVDHAIVALQRLAYGLPERQHGTIALFGRAIHMWHDATRDQHRRHE